MISGMTEIRKMSPSKDTRDFKVLSTLSRGLLILDRLASVNRAMALE